MALLAAASYEQRKSHGDRPDTQNAGAASRWHRTVLKSLRVSGEVGAMFALRFNQGKQDHNRLYVVLDCGQYIADGIGHSRMWYSQLLVLRVTSPVDSATPGE